MAENVNQEYRELTSTPTTPATGRQKLYPLTDGDWYLLDDAATERRLNTSGGGVANGFTTTATAAGTTTLTVASTPVQEFTGATTQDCVLPDATTLIVGWTFIIRNVSTGAVTVKANGGATLVTLAANQQVTLYCKTIGTAAGTWSQEVVTGTGARVLAQSPTIVTPTIASFANAAHNHTNAAGGGQLTDAALSAVIGVAKGGTAADLSATGAATHFLRQASAGAAVTVGAIVSADLTTPLLTPPAIGSTTPNTGLFTNVTVGQNADATTRQVAINAAAGQLRLLIYQTGGSRRWYLYADQVAESGSNAGSDFIINAYDDASAFIGAWLKITRANGKITLPSTITTVGTTGNQTINKATGRVNIAAAGTTVTVTNSLVTANSIVLAEIATNDATARIANVVPGAGSFVINIVACTAETAINWLVLS